MSKTLFPARISGAIEAEMRKLTGQALPLCAPNCRKKRLLPAFEQEDEPYKAEIAAGLAAELPISTYTCGDFTDLCKGPHACRTQVSSRPAKLISSAGAYWRGDEKPHAFKNLWHCCLFRTRRPLRPTSKSLNRQRPATTESFQGANSRSLPFMRMWRRAWFSAAKGHDGPYRAGGFLAQGAFEKGLYEIVQGPQLLRVETWQKSGHYDHYRENMYFTKIEEDEYGIKPMNCIGHMLIYRHDMRSYRDMPPALFRAWRSAQARKAACCTAFCAFGNSPRTMPTYSARARTAGRRDPRSHPPDSRFDESFGF